MYYPIWATSAEARLAFYSAEFPLVEVDSTYYGMPTERNSALWASRTPADFTFNVKAFRLFTTHQTEPGALPRTVQDQLPLNLAMKKDLYYRDLPAELREPMWQTFESALAPLYDAGKLGVVVFQFPPWFMPLRENYGYIEECKRRLPRYRIAVEFRNRYWLVGDKLEETLGLLRHNDICFIAVDEPRGFKSSVPPIADVTGPYGIVRFHGRNRNTWERRALRSASERFDYYYSRDELEEWAPKIRTMRKSASEVHLVMNTNNKDQGIVNARLLGDILDEGLKPRARLF